MDYGRLKPDGERFLPQFRGVIELEHYHRYYLALTLVDGKDVLDIASGEGFGSEILSKRARSVVGVDISLDAIVHASSQYVRENLRFIEGSATQIPLPDNSVDVIVSFETIEHLAEHDAMMAELKRVLKAEGCLIISSPNKLVYTDRPNYTNPFHVRELYTPDFLRLTSRHFAHVRHYGQRVSTCSIVATGELEEPFTTYSPAAVARGVPDQMYDIILASDGTLPTLGSSAFEQPHGPLQPQKIDALTAEVASKSVTVNRLERELEERRAVADDLERQTEEMRTVVKSLEREVEERREVTARLAGQAEERLATVARLEREVDDARVASVQLEQEVENWRFIAKQLEENVETRRAHVERLEEEIASLRHKTSHFGAAVYQVVCVVSENWKESSQRFRNEVQGAVDRSGATAMNMLLSVRLGIAKISRLLYLPRKRPKASHLNFANPDGYYSRKIVHRPITNQRQTSGLRLAVVVHAFYLDTALEILDLLRNIRVPFALFLSTTAENAERLRSAASARLPQAQLRLVIAQNRGRNFGPMLVELRKTISEHDVLLHLHTKQSLRTGGEQAHWRQHILNHLIGSVEVVQSILKLYQDDPRIGVVGPVNDLRVVPYWCQYWLANSHLAQQWLPRFGVDHFPRLSLLDFPVGGMFWARTASISGILTYAWKYEDFAPEPIPADGTVAHMLERAIGVVSISSGYTYAETNLESNSIRIGGSEKSLPQYVHQAANLTNDASHFSVISFDFYDTLFARLACSPEDVQHYVGHYLFSKGLTKDPSVFFLRRKQSERELRERSGYDGDIGIAEIFDSMSPSEDFGQMAIEAAYLAEMEVELRVLVPRPDVVNLARRLAAQGKRLIIVSDSYMPKDFFETVLRKFGLEGIFSEIYVSSHERKRKDNGSLWRHLAQSEARHPGNFLHIGDNFRSDMQIPGDLGLSVFGVLSTSVLAKMNGASTPALWDLGETDWRSGILLGPQVAAIGASALSGIGGYPLRIESPQKVGYCVLGPLFFGFIAWLTRRAKSDGVNHLYFLARDCEHLKVLYTEIRTSLPELGMPEPMYLEVSRRAVLPAAIAAGLPILSFIMGTGYYSGTFGSFLESRLGMNPSDINPDDRSIAINPLGEAHIVLELINRNKDRIFAHCNSSLELVTRFLLRSGLRTNSSLSDVALVDLGYSGTIQTSLQAILDTQLKGYYFATSFKARDLDKKDGFATGYFGDQLIGGEQPDVYRFSLLLEAFLQSSSGSVMSYRSEEGEVHPNYGPVLKRNVHELRMLRECMAGAREYCFDLLNAYGSNCLQIEFSPRESEKPFLALVRGDITLAPELEACLTVDDDFCGNGVMSAIRHVRWAAGAE